MSKTIRNPIAKDLRTPKYRMRVVEDKKHSRPKHKNDFLKECV